MPTISWPTEPDRGSLYADAPWTDANGKQWWWQSWKERWNPYPPAGGGGSGAVDSVNGMTGAVTITKSTVSLGNVDNTSDLNKPISTLTQAALDLKANASALSSYLTIASASATYSLLGHTHAQLHDAATVTGNGISIAGQQISLSIGTGSTQVAAGNHTHAQLHDAVTVTGNGISLTGQQLSLSIGTGATQVAAGDHTHAQLHDRSHAMTSTSDHTAGNWKVFYSNGSGQLVELALGADGTYLRSNGAALAPSFDTPAGGSSGVTVQDEGSPLATTATTLNFVGNGVAASGAGATKTITIAATVESVAVVTANGVSASIANPTSNPSMTFSLGAITPSSVFSSSSVLMGTNSMPGGSNVGYGATASSAALVGGSFQNTNAAGYEGFNFHNQSGTLVSSFAHSNSGVGFLPSSTWMGSRLSEPLHFLMNSTVYMTVSTAGKVGIGTQSPADPLSVVGAISSTTQVSAANFKEGVTAMGTVVSTATITITGGSAVTATLTASTACTFTMPTAAAGLSFVLYLKQAATTGNGTATFTGVVWPAGTAPTITATAGKMDILSFVAGPDAAGSGFAWYGSFIQNLTPP